MGTKRNVEDIITDEDDLRRRPDLFYREWCDANVSISRAEAISEGTLHDQDWQSYDEWLLGARRTSDLHIMPQSGPIGPQSAPIDLTQQDETRNTDAHKKRKSHGHGASICNCGEDKDDELVRCADPGCMVEYYHRACVGLSNKAKYRDTSQWRCSACRNHSAPVPAASTSLPAPAVAPEPPLHPEQLAIVSHIEQGHNTFYTGSAGTGKSTVLKSFVKGLQAQGKQVDIVAPSGIAALAIGGSTIFSYAGWHPDIFKNELKKLVEKAHSKTVRKRLCKTDVLVIDEISMVESDMLTRLDYIMKDARNGYKPDRNERKPKSPHIARMPFGGVQIIVTGDFCQLPPVKPFQYCLFCGGGETDGAQERDGAPRTCRKCNRVCKDQDKWAFRSPAWAAAEFTCFELKHIHRQSDSKFISILQKYRRGEPLTQAEKTLLLQKKTNMEGAVKLLPQKAEVNRNNQNGLRALGSVSKKYDCLDFFDFRSTNEPELRKKGDPANAQNPYGPLAALKDHRYEQQIELKVGMLAILLVNLDLKAGLVNGSQGRIVRFEAYNPNTTLVQRPPSEGNSSKESDAISEIASIKEDQMRAFIERAPQQEWPVVQFNNGTIKTIYANCQINELGSEKPYSLLGRTQIPLVAAWAITIHKSQGMTLDKVSVDLYNSFEKEMAYVALSRARSLEGLEVLRLPRDSSKGMNPEVMQFLKDNLRDDAS